MIGKVISTVYNGGSRPGTRREVLVDSVNGNLVRIFDLYDGSPKAYHLDRMSDIFEYDTKVVDIDALPDLHEMDEYIVNCFVKCGYNTTKVRDQIVAFKAKKNYMVEVRDSQNSLVARTSFSCNQSDLQSKLDKLKE